jgi:hypothetical protein
MGMECTQLKSFAYMLNSGLSASPPKAIYSAPLLEYVQNIVIFEQKEQNWIQIIVH